MRTPPYLLLIVLLAGLNSTVWPQAFPINSNVALQPAEDQLIYRTQIRYRNFEVDATDAQVNVWSQSNVFVYGWTSSFSTVLGVPLLYRDFEDDASSNEDFGIGDINLLLRYQLWKKLGYLQSESWTALGGVQIPSYDAPFSSRSWDPILGTVYSWRKNRYGFDADLVFQLNTENDRDMKQGNVLRYDTALQYRLWPTKYTAQTKWSLTGLLELNGRAQGENKSAGHKIGKTNSHQILLSPGLVLAGKRVKYEAGMQLPIFQDIGRNAAEDSIRLVFGVTITY